MDLALSADARLRSIVDRLLASTSIDPDDRAFLEEAKEILGGVEFPRLSPIETAPVTGASAAAKSSTFFPPTIEIRHDPHTVPEPSVVSLQTKEGDR